MQSHPLQMCSSVCGYSRRSWARVDRDRGQECPDGRTLCPRPGDRRRDPDLMEAKAAGREMSGGPGLHT